MNQYGNSFVTARAMAKKLATIAVICCIASVVLGFVSALLQAVATLFTLIVMITLVVTIFTRCKCPHCGKVISFGVLQATVCPRCRRSLISGKKLKK